MGWLKPSSVVQIFTDGSCLGKPHFAGGWAAVIIEGESCVEIYGHDAPTTNNRMEMMAALRALETLPTGSHVYLHTDSRYLQQGMQYWLIGWKRRQWKTLAGQDVFNQDLWKLLDLQNARHVVSWLWVKGHDGHTHNERCDELARAAALKHAVHCTFESIKEVSDG